MTEFTICESFKSIDSPYMMVLKEPKPYGAIIGETLIDQGLIFPRCRICEVGGGYGSLMKGFLEVCSPLVRRIYMVDLSRFLIGKQKKVLQKWSSITSFINADITELIPALSNIDAIIINEVIGDLETHKNLSASNLPRDIKRLIDKYGLEVPKTGTFNFNSGAILLVEEICKKGIPAFITEHSSDPIIPRDMPYLGKGLEIDGFPRAIKLRGHFEFNIRFSHLVKVAEAWGRNVTGGSMIDLVGIEKSNKMRIIFTSRSCATDEHEIIYELLDHIREYRWMIIK
jgi:hypothetical protein